MTDVPSEIQVSEPAGLPEKAAQSLPAPVPGTVRVEAPPSYGSRLREEWEALHPALRAALTCWPAIVVFAILEFGSLGTLAPFCYPVQLVVYGFVGALAVRGVRRESRANSAFGLALLAGVVLAGLDILTYFVVNVLVGAATGGLGLVGLCCMAACAPFDATISILSAGLGGILYTTFERGNV